MNGVLLLFDVDGTLLHSSGAGMRAMRRVGIELFGDNFRWDGVETAGSLDPVIFAEVATRNGLEDIKTHHDRFRKSYLKTLAKELKRGGTVIRVMPGIRRILDILKRRADTVHDVTLGLLTGNYGPAVTLKFATVDLDLTWFPITVFGDDAPTRPDLAALALRRFEEHAGSPADPSRSIVIGDTPRDVACAHANRCVSFAVATGSHRTEQLIEAGADYVVRDLRDPDPLLSLVDRLIM